MSEPLTILTQQNTWQTLYSKILMWWTVMWFLMHWSHGAIVGHPPLHTCCYSHHYLGRCWSKPNCCLDRATFGGHPLTGPPASLFRLPKLVLSVICVPAATAAAVALVQCGNVAGDMASKGKQTEKQQVKERDTIRKHDERKQPDKKPSLKVKRSYFSRVLATLYVSNTKS